MLLRRKIVARLLILVALFSGASCTTTIGGNIEKCEMPTFGYAETGFANCKPSEAWNRLNFLVKQNNPEALYMVGRIYEMGGGNFGLQNIKQDEVLAEKFYLESAKLGYAKAQAAIGYIYEKYYQDSRKADGYYWFCKSALQGNAMAVANINVEIRAENLDQTTQQYCDQTLKSPPE